MNKEKVIQKGYTLSVTSWENDGDNYATESKTFESKELAIAVAQMCKNLFQSKNNGKPKGIGNMMDDDGRKARPIILEYMKEHPELYTDKKKPSDATLHDICMTYNGELMGYSEYYYSRVFEKATLTYSPEDVYLEKIKF